MTHPLAMLRLRFAALGVGVLILFWLPFEDLAIYTALALGLLLSAWLAARACIRHPSLSPLLICGAAGAAVTPLAVGLAVFKSGLHGHGVPDFTLDQVFAIFQQTPWFILGGLLIGAGLHLHRSPQLPEE